MNPETPRTLTTAFPQEIAVSDILSATAAPGAWGADWGTPPTPAHARARRTASTTSSRTYNDDHGTATVTRFTIYQTADGRLIASDEPIRSSSRPDHSLPHLDCMVEFSRIVANSSICRSSGVLSAGSQLFRPRISGKASKRLTEAAGVSSSKFMAASWTGGATMEMSRGLHSSWSGPNLGRGIWKSPENVVRSLARDDTRDDLMRPLLYSCCISPLCTAFFKLYVH